MKPLLLTILFLTICLSQGCINQFDIDSQLARCPQFVRDEVGEISYKPLHPASFLLLSGATHKPTGRVLLFAMADKHTILHEIAHSVYFRTPHVDFKADFKASKGFISIFAIGHAEAVAEAFVEGMKGRSNPRIDCAMEFFEGRYE